MSCPLLSLLSPTMPSLASSLLTLLVVVFICHFANGADFCFTETDCGYGQKCKEKACLDNKFCRSRDSDCEKDQRCHLETCVPAEMANTPPKRVSGGGRVAAIVLGSSFFLLILVGFGAFLWFRNRRHSGERLQECEGRSRFF